MLLGLVRPPAASAPNLVGLTLTTIGNMTGDGGLAAAFDGTCVRSYTTAASLAAPAEAIVGLTYGVPRVVYAVVVIGPTDRAFCSTGGSRAIVFEGSNDNSSWTSIWAGTYPDGNGATVIFRNLPNTPYTYHRVRLTGDSNGTMRVAQMLAY